MHYSVLAWPRGLENHSVPPFELRSVPE
jgi:hypothetical protein